MIEVSAEKASTERYQLALEAAGIGIWDNDLLTDTIHFSGYSHELFDIPKNTLINLQTLYSKIHPADLPKVQSKVKASLDPDVKASYESEYRIINSETGEVIRWLRSKGRAYFTDVNTPYRFTGTLQDITTEIKARETQQKLLTLVDNSIELMSILENDQKNSYLNKAGMEMLGFDSLEQVNQTPITELHTPEDIAFVQANVLPSVAEKGRWSGIMNVRHLKTGEVFPVYNNTIRIHDPVSGEPIAVGAVMRDMRPEVASRKALEESEQNFRTLVMQAPVGICILRGEDFIVEMANDSFLEVAWKKREDMIGKKVADVFPEATTQGFVQMLQGVYTTGMPFYGKETEVVQEREGQVKTIYVDFTFQPLFEADGSVNRILDLSIDVTDKVLARKQLQQSEEELQKRVAERTAELEKKNKELEEFTYVSSHDLQEPIRKIKMFREMVREKDYHNLSDFSKEKFDKVGESIDRMSNSLKDLLNFARLDNKEVFEEVDLTLVLANVENDLELMIQQKNAVIKRSNLPIIKGIALQMHQLFYNLLNNALKFSRPDATPMISIHVETKRGDALLHKHLIDEGKDYYVITVQDNGIGFDPSKAEKIFGMFQRLHSRQAYSGTGIGLAMCKKVAMNHQGSIYALSESGKGSAFVVALPIT